MKHQQQNQARSNIAVYILFGGCLLFFLMTFLYLDRRENLRLDYLIKTSNSAEEILKEIKEGESQSEITPESSQAHRNTVHQINSLLAVFESRSTDITGLLPEIEVLKTAPKQTTCSCTNQLLFRENEIGQFKKQRSFILSEIAKKQMNQQCPYLKDMSMSIIPESALQPYPLKLERLIEYGKKYGIRVMVETGTYYGSTSIPAAAHFKKVYTIELSHELYTNNLPGFLNTPNAISLEGDSSVLLKTKVLPEINEPTIFWLDGHYSSTGTARGEVDSPIFYELTQILQHPLASKFIIIIDDMRLFKGYDSECKDYHSDQIQCYPSIQEIGQIFCAFQKNHQMSIRVDEDATIAIGGEYLRKSDKSDK